MGRTPKYPDVLESILSLSIHSFHIKPCTANLGSITWRGNKINFGYVARKDKGTMRLDMANKVCLIQFVAIPSNLGKGVYWLWLCPLTEKRCSKLYFYDNQFVHRSKVPVNYEDQNYSKYLRLLDRMFRLEFSNIEDEIFKPYFKMYYRGQLTKRMQKIIKQVEKNKKESQERYLEFIKILTNKKNEHY